MKQKIIAFFIRSHTYNNNKMIRCFIGITTFLWIIVYTDHHRNKIILIA